MELVPSHVTHSETTLEHDAPTDVTMPRMASVLEQHVPHPLSESIGRDPVCFLPSQGYDHYHGLSILVVNQEGKLVGIRHDVKALELMYTGKKFRVLGGDNHQEKAAFRELTEDDIKQMFKKLNNSFDRKIQLLGAHYDCVYMHFFAPGNAEMLFLSDTQKARKVNMINLAAEMLTNLEKQVPVSLFFHTSQVKGQPLERHPTNMPEDIGRLYHDSINIIGYHSVPGHVDGYDPEQNGSWIVQKFAEKMAASGELADIVQALNEEASDCSHPPMRATDKGFKRLPVG